MAFSDEEREFIEKVKKGAKPVGVGTSVQNPSVKVVSTREKLTFAKVFEGVAVVQAGVLLSELWQIAREKGYFSPFPPFLDGTVGGLWKRRKFFSSSNFISPQGVFHDGKEFFEVETFEKRVSHMNSVLSIPPDVDFVLTRVSVRLVPRLSLWVKEQSLNSNLPKSPSFKFENLKTQNIIILKTDKIYILFCDFWGFGPPSDGFRKAEFQNFFLGVRKTRVSSDTEGDGIFFPSAGIFLRFV